MKKITSLLIIPTLVLGVLAVGYWVDQDFRQSSEEQKYSDKQEAKAANKPSLKSAPRENQLATSSDVTEDWSAVDSIASLEADSTLRSVGVEWSEEEEIEVDDAEGSAEAFTEAAEYWDNDPVLTTDATRVMEAVLHREYPIMVSFLTGSESDTTQRYLEKRFQLSDKRTANVSVEEWISPNKFKGYRFNGRKLMLYGVTTVNPRIFYLEESYYLANDGEFFLLIQDTREHRLVPVDNAGISHSMNTHAH